jgi:hypothetical protein
MLKPNIKYRVTLTAEERGFLENLVKKGDTAGYRIRHAQTLPALDEIQANETRTGEKIGKAYKTGMRAIGNLRKRFVEEGFEAALERKKREVPPAIKIDGGAEAGITALACRAPPAGRSRRTLALLADKVAELGILDGISDHGIGDLLKKTKLSHGYRKNGALQPHPPNMPSGWRAC